MSPEHNRKTGDHAQDRDWLQVTLSSIGEAVITTDAVGRVSFLNPTAESLTGWPQAEAVGRPLTDIFRILNEQTRQPVENPAERALREGRIVGLANHTVLIARDGTERQIADSAAPIRSADGNVGGVVLVFRDVSERRRAERALRESEERKAAILNTALDCIITMDHEGRIIEFNPAAERTFGHRRDDVLGRDMADLIIPPSLRESHRRGLAHYLATGEGPVLGRHLELTALRADGSVFPVEVAIVPISVEGRPIFTGYLRDITERKAAEAARREGEERLRLALDAGRMGTWEWDLRANRVEWSPGLEAIHGIAPGSFEGTFEAFQRDMHPDDRDRVLRSITETVEQGGEHRVEYRIIQPDGSIHWLEARRRLFRDEEGRPARIVGVCIDVTERKQAEEANAKLAAIVESSDDAIISKNLSGIITSWNESAERLFGYTADEAIGRPVTILIPPDRLDEESRILEHLKGGERVDHFETIRVRKDGGLLDISLTISPIKDVEGRIVGASKIARDVTERRRAEEIARFLADASANLAMLVDHRSTLHKVAQLAVPFFADWCAVDLVDEGSLKRLATTHVDPGKLELVQELSRRYPPDPQAKVGPMHVLRTGRPELVPEIPDELLTSSARDEEHLRILRELGLRSYICVPLIVRGRIFGILTFVSAESDRTYGPGDLAVAEDLTHRAAIAIENARLYSEAKEADRRKDEFLAMLAHELRNPLAPIRSGLDLLMMQGEQAEVVDLMKEQVDHLVRLVDDLLDLSRIMQGRIELRREPVEVSTFVNRAVEMSRSQIEEHGHHLFVAQPSEPIWVNADAVRLAQVVTNLLNNAVKYTEPGGRISLSVRRSGPAVEVGVADTGIGIEPDFLPHVFDLFTQDNRSLDRAQGGLGVGLTLVQNLVDLHGGTAEAYSEGVGRGSRFVVRLPVLAGADASPAPAGDAPPESPVRRILVVDDTRAAAKMLSLLLSKLGPHEIEMAHDGPSALQRVEMHRPEIVFLDIGLPGMDGYEVARRLRDRPECAAALLVALTGYGQEEDRRRSREAGFDEHLVKPPALDDVARMLVHPRLVEETRDERREGRDERREGRDERREGRDERDVDNAHGPRPAGSARAQPVGSELSSHNSRLSSLPSDLDRRAEVDRRKDDFLRKLIHEIGNVIVPMQMAVQIMQRSQDDPPAAARVQEMLARHLPAVSKLLTDLRRVSRVCRNNYAMHVEPTDLAEVVRRAAERVRPLIESQSCSLSVLLPEQPAAIDTDRGLLEEALVELLNNAARFTPARGRISLSAEPSGDEVALRVRDEGTGIEPELLARVFDPFVRGESEPDFARGHFGVGLAFVRNVVELHGGRVEAHSAPPARGSEFVLHLPLKT